MGRTHVQVHGAIYLKCDGRKLIIAFKKEIRSEKDRWFSFDYKMMGDTLIPVS
jgi:hypothetical protein